MNRQGPKESSGKPATGATPPGSPPRPPYPVQQSGPPPLPGTEDSSLPPWALLVPVVALILLSLLLIPMLFSPPGPDSQASTGSGSVSQDNSPNESSGNASEDGEGATTDTDSPAGSENPTEQEQKVQPSNSTEPNDTTDIKASEPGPILKDQESKQESKDPQNVTTQAHATDKPPDTKELKQSPSNHFFTLDSLPVRKRSLRPEKKSVAPSVTRDNALSGRQEGAKEQLLREQGGTGATEAAVKLGLEWLARNQQSDGLWSLSGPYGQGGSSENFAAASAMALIAFQGAGHTPRGDAQEPFTRVVAKGWQGLLQFFESNNSSMSVGGLHGGYTQALCTIALCELYGMTRAQRYRRPAQMAVDYCLQAQSPQGGWRYVPGQDSDTSVTGWFVMALQSARMAKLQVPQSTFDSVSQYLNNAATHGGERYSYQPGTAATLSMSAEGLLCRQYLGWQHDDPRLIAGTEFLLQNLPDWRSPDLYYWYYATQVTHHMGGDSWRRWNDVMSVLLPAKQVREGAERGSWYPQMDAWGNAGGRLYATCLSIYMLEVYYRHLPLYQHAAVANGNK